MTRPTLRDAAIGLSIIAVGLTSGLGVARLRAEQAIEICQAVNDLSDVLVSLIDNSVPRPASTPEQVRARADADASIQTIQDARCTP